MLWRVSILLVLGVINAVLFSRVIWGSTGIMEYRALKHHYATLRQQIADLDVENMALSRDIRLLQSDNHYTEKMVRKKLRYLRDNEIVYLFTNPNKNGDGASTNDGKN